MSNTGTALSAEEAERFRAYERRRHDSLAVTYREFFSAVTALAIDPLLSAAKVRAGTRLLDVGSGPGFLAARAAGMRAQAAGIDLSPGMVQLATQSHPEIDFRVADVEHLPFEEESFDAVVGNFALGHLPNPEAAVGECLRTLKPGGRIALSWWGDPSKQRFQGLFRDAIAEIGAAAPPDVPTGHSMLRFTDTNEFRRLLEGAGLGEVAVDDHQTIHLVPDVETLWRGGLGSFAITASAITHQSADTQQAIRAALERRAEMYKTPAGLQLPVAFKVGSGRKPG